MHYEAHNPRREHVVLHVPIPRRPEALKVVEVHIVFRDLIELAPIGCWLGAQEEASRSECGIPIAQGEVCVSCGALPTEEGR